MQVYWIFAAWNEIEALTIVKSWQNLLDHKDSMNCESEVDKSEKETSKVDNVLLTLLPLIPANKSDFSARMAKHEECEINNYDIVTFISKEKITTANQKKILITKQV